MIIKNSFVRSLRFDIVIVSEPLLIALEEVWESPGIYQYYLKNPRKVLKSWKIGKRVLENPGFSINFSVGILHTQNINFKF